MADAALRGIAWGGAVSTDPGHMLVARVARGDRQALEEIWTAHGRALSGYLRQLCADPELCQEVLQDTLVAAWQGARRFRGASTLRTWLIGIARRQMLSALRKRRLPLGGDQDLLAIPDPDPGPADSAVASAERAELAAVLGRLSPIHREVLTLAFVEDLSYPEMASVLAVPLGTVKSRLSNAKRALRVLLESREAHRT